MEQLHDTREGWLGHGIVLVAPLFAEKGYPLPANIKVSCGYPIGARGGKKILAQAISAKASAAGNRETFINPVLADPLTVMGALLHELCHHAVGVEAGHGAAFKACAAALGLEGKATEAMPGRELRDWVNTYILPLLGEYPHAAVDPNARKKQGTRMIKLVCPETGYTVRTTQKWLAHGVPTSPAGCEMIVAGGEEESED